MKLIAYLKKSLPFSRRKIFSLIKEEKIKANEKTITKSTYRLQPKDKVFFENRLLHPNEKNIYIIVNKPPGFVCTLKDKFAPKKVIDLVPKKFKRLVIAGRLDKDSRGLVLLTNDGNLVYKITHPKFEIEKEYLVKIKPALKEADIKKIERGIKVEDIVYRVKKIQTIEKTASFSHLKIILNEGKKREIRNIFGFLGYIVEDLKRIRIGKVKLKNLKEGEYKVINKKEII
ncbi:MAG TPA: rRNA pseudouridine synthase [Candidatus Omnitrophica bacterium]|nr:rRNA pseudouridine synthase [Candidatus Omnitrophota bacterium]